MGTLAENLQEIVDIKENIRLAINGKGVTVTTDDKFNVYPDKIRQIERNVTQYVDFEKMGYTVQEENMANRLLNLNVITQGQNFNITSSAQSYLEDEDWVMSRTYFPAIMESVNNPQEYDWFATNKNLIMVPYLDFDNWNTTIQIGSYFAYPGIGMGGLFYECSNLEYFGGAKRLTGPAGVSVDRLKKYFNVTSSVTPTYISDILTGHTFYNCKKLKTIGDIDFPDSIKNDTRGYHTTNMFYGCESLTEIGEWLSRLPIQTMGGMFYNCKNLKTIPKLKMGDANGSPFNQNTFSGCSALENFSGFENFTYLYTGGIVEIWLYSCSLLTRESCLNIFNTIPTCPFNWEETGWSWRVNLHPDVVAKLSAEDIAILTSKGWRLRSGSDWITE